LSRITPFQIAMGVGAAGALVDVSTYADLAAGVQRSWGRRTEFEDIAPGVFSFVLDNSDGRFTPGNTASPLTTTVTEGMAVCWNTGGRLVAGTILAIEPTFPNDESAWAQIRITCDDMLGAAGRRELGDTLAKSIVSGANPYLYWPLDDPATGATVAAEQSGNIQPNIELINGLFTLGTAASIFSNSQLQMGGSYSAFTNKPFTTISYATSSMGAWGCWVTPTAATSGGEIRVYLVGLGLFLRLGIDGFTNSYIMRLGSNNVTSTSVFPAADVPHYLSAVITYSGSSSITGEFFIDGVSQGTCVWGGFPTGLGSDALRTPSYVGFNGGSVSAGQMNFSLLSHTASRLNLEYAYPTSETNALTAIDQAVPEIVLGSVSSGLSSAAVQVVGGSSALDAINALLVTEQGTIYSTVSGTLTSPTQTLTVRERTRPTTVTASWDVARELDGAPQFVRDITNMVSTITASGPTQDVTLTDATLTARVGSSNSSETVLNTGYVDLLMWDQDRLQRGANVQLRLASVTIDAMTTPTDRTSDLLALVPGDRHQFTGLPSTQLGFSTWDGWLLGVDETHTLTEHTFTLYFQPVLPATAIFDTNYFMGDTDLTLSASITSGATTMSVATATTTTKLETTTFPYTLAIDSEQVTVTACTGATPQVATITRGVNGTTAAAHSSGAAVEVAVPSLYAF